jgi:hypothetical protein
MISKGGAKQIDGFQVPGGACLKRRGFRFYPFELAIPDTIKDKKLTTKAGVISNVKLSGKNVHQGHEELVALQGIRPCIRVTTRTLSARNTHRNRQE